MNWEMFFAVIGVISTALFALVILGVSISILTFLAQERARARAELRAAVAEAQRVVQDSAMPRQQKNEEPQ